VYKKHVPKKGRLLLVIGAVHALTLKPIPPLIPHFLSFDARRSYLKGKKTHLSIEDRQGLFSGQLIATPRRFQSKLDIGAAWPN
jgi:hypothetical protein